MSGKTTLRWAFALAYMAGIHLWTATGGRNPTSTLPVGVDKIIHLCEFGLLAWLLWRPWRETLPRWAEGKTAAFVLLLTALNGATDELHQLYLPLRTATWGDLAADIAGGGVAVWWRLHREKARPRATTQG